MALNTDNLARCIQTLDSSYQLLLKQAEDSIDYEIFRNAVIKGYELSLETSGKLLRKAIKPYFASPLEADNLYFKDVFRQAAKRGLITPEDAESWFQYRDNRNTTAHDYGVGFAENTLKLIPSFIEDCKKLREILDESFSKS